MSSVIEDRPSTPAAPHRGNAPALLLAAVAALLSSACCVLPLVLVLVGLSGAWTSRLRWLQPYSSTLTVIALLSLGLAAWRLYRRTPDQGDACPPGGGAVCRVANRSTRRWFWLVAVLTLIPLVVPLLAPLFY
jgi:mercuric ion transport protein